MKYDRTALLVLVIGCAAAVAGCGIPQISYLAPPIEGTTDTLPPIVRFTHDPLNDRDTVTYGFLGYEIYYKFYASASAQTQFDTDRASVEDAGPGTVVGVLGQRGFDRAYALDRPTRPAIRVEVPEPTDPDDPPLSVSVTIQFQFTSQADKHAEAQWTVGQAEVQSLIRDQDLLAAREPDLGFRIDDLEPGIHEDLPAATALTGSTISMAVAILAYGIDYNAFAPIYSTAIVADQLLEISYQ